MGILDLWSISSLPPRIPYLPPSHSPDYLFQAVSAVSFTRFHKRLDNPPTSRRPVDSRVTLAPPYYQVMSGNGVRMVSSIRYRHYSFLIKELRLKSHPRMLPRQGSPIAQYLHHYAFRRVRPCPQFQCDWIIPSDQLCVTALQSHYSHQ